MKKLFNLTYFVAGLLLLIGTMPVASQTGGFANVSQPSSSVTVSSGSALISAIQQGNQTVYVSGSISISGMNDVASNTAIIGLGTNARITGGGLDIDGVTNVIVQNITFEGADDDAINIQEGSTHVWVDHCSFGPCSDGQVDIKRESDFITISWNHSYGGHDHCFLLGHSDSHTEDIGHLRVTYHHNYFEGEGRNPRVRFSALCHVYNNYYNGCNYGVASTQDAECLVEGNYFNNVDDPCLVGYASSGDGDLVERNNVYNNSGSPETRGSVPNPSYSYSLQSATDARSAVINGAGVNGGITEVPVTGVSVSPTSSSLQVGQTQQLTATVSPSNATNNGVSWSSSNTGVATVNSSGLVSGVSAGNATITVRTDDGGYTATCNVTISEGNVPVTGVSVSPTSTSVRIGSTTQLTATISPSNATNKNVSWSSSNTGIVTVSSSGVVSGVALGSATITVTTQDGNYQASSAVQVVEAGDCDWVEYQAEDGSYSSGSVETEHSGYTGSGYVNTDNEEGVWFEVTVDVPSAGVHDVSVRYANGGDTDRSQRVDVNGSTAISNLSMTSTSSWDIWSTVNFTISLNAGNNTLRFTSLTSVGAPNIDRIDVCQGGSTPDNNPPNAVASASPTSGTAPLSVSFDASGSTDPDGDALSYSWNFGDGSTGSGATPSHTYSSDGSFTATVTVSDGELSDQASVSISVGSGGEPCDNPVSISIPFSQDGVGEYCWITTQEPAYVNSWNLEELTINGVDYTNTWSNSMPAAQNGAWVIHYVGNYGWSHFEAPQAKSAIEEMGSNEIRMFPNPLNEEDLTVLINNPKGESLLKIIDMDGRLVFDNKFEEESFIKFKLDVQPGIYLVQVINNNKLFVNRLVIE